MSLELVLVLVALILVAVYLMNRSTLSPTVRNAIIIGLVVLVVLLILKLTGVLAWRVDVD